MKKKETVEADQGNDVVLTIDERIQEFVSKFGEENYNKYKPKKLSIIVMDPNNGDVLALDNYPKYDPNFPRKSLDEKEQKLFESLSDEAVTEKYYDMWRSFAVNDVYEPGSVFKFITASAAYEEKTANDSINYRCDGEVEVDDTILRCYRYYDPHGDQNFVEAMDHSCNPAFIKIAQDLGKEKMYEYIKKFGFGKKTGIDLPAEEEGIIPKSLDEISNVRLATLSYGHGIAVTPIQMITAINAVVNGGNLYKPRIVKEIEDSDTNNVFVNNSQVVRRVISKETSKKMREMMKSGVEHGTADGAKISGYDVGGKTGTSVKFVDGAYQMETTVASFLGVFPSENPKYTILAVIDEPKGASSGNVVAASCVKNIIKSIIDLEGILPDSSAETDSEEVEVPDIVGLKVLDAVNLLIENGLEHSITSFEVDSDDLVLSQAPAKGEKIRKGSIVDIMTENNLIGKVEVPDILNLKFKDARSILDSMHLSYDEHKGDSVISYQKPSAGFYVEEGSYIYIETNE